MCVIMSPDYQGCHLCENTSEFVCSQCERPICGNDSRIRVICSQCLKPTECSFSLHQAHCEDIGVIENLVERFWGEPDQRIFDRTFRVTDYPAIVAEIEEKVVGFIAFTPFNQHAVLIVAVGILPQYQGCGIGKAFLKEVEDYARQQQKQQLLVVTSNDNLPALAFYQQNGFQLFEVIPNVIAQKLGSLQLGIAKIPIRDELRLRKLLQ